jgi:hypothetical protein
MSLSPGGLTHQVDAADIDIAAGRQQAAGQHLQCGGLPRAIMSEQPKHFSALQFQRHVMNDLVIPKAARKIACSKGYFGRNFLQCRVVVVVVSLTKYNLLCASLSKAVSL